MAKPLYIFPYSMRSASIHSLRSKLPESRIIKREGSQFNGKGKTVINWGSSTAIPEVLISDRIVNHPDFVSIASNKLKFFKRVASLKKDTPRIPEWTTDFTEVVKWVAEGYEVVGRQKLEASGGEGILFSSDVALEEMASCKLFTKYIKKKEEYRVHIAFGKPLFIQKKVLRKTDDTGTPIDPKTIDWRVRNLANGFIFQKNDITPNPDVITQALFAINVSRLDFGAVDVIWNGFEERAYVLEINTAPGLEATSVDSYAEAFKANLL